MLFFLDNLLISQESVSLQCVFHSIRFKVNKGWSKALLLFLCPNLIPVPISAYHKYKLCIDKEPALQSYHPQHFP